MSLESNNLREVAAWHFNCFDRSLIYENTLEKEPAMALEHLSKGLEIVATLRSDNTELLLQISNLGKDLLRIGNNTGVIGDPADTSS